MSENNNNQEKQTEGFVVEIYEWLEAVAFALAIVVLLFTFLFRVVSVSGPSMNPTLFSGDRIVLNSLFTRLRTAISWLLPSRIHMIMSRLSSASLQSRGRPFRWTPRQIL